MPIPQPKKNQNEDKYVEDCMSNSQMGKDFPNEKQRYAVCKSTFNRAKKAKASEGDESNVNWLDMKDDSYIIH